MAADGPRKTDLAERAPGAADRDHDLAAGDDAKVASVARRRCTHSGSRSEDACVRSSGGKHADAGAAASLDASGGGLHDAAEAAADDDARLVRASRKPDVVGKGGRSRALQTLAPMTLT